MTLYQRKMKIEPSFFSLTLFHFIKIEKFMFRYTILFSLLIFNFISLVAQGKVIINESPAIKSMFQDYVEKQRAQTTIKGWRIQIISTDDRREMETAKSRFSSLYPGMPTAWKHVSPYYHVRIGAYRTKNELMSFLTEIKREFPAAIAVMDDINKYDLINY